MKRTEKLSPIVVVVALALFMGVAPPVASLVLGRTGSELSLFLLLNGERTRPVQSDGGGLMLWTTDAGIASVSVSGGNVYYVECSAKAHLCGPGSDGTWDGGCSSTVADPNYGSPIAADGYRWISLRDGTTTLRAVPASGSASVSCPVYLMR